MYIIDQVTIDVKKKEFTVSGNGFPTQTKAFEDEDEWGSIQNYKGEHVLDYNIWWDEQWGFQYSAPEQLEDGRWQTGSDYKNPEKMIFVNGDMSPIYDSPEIVIENNIIITIEQAIIFERLLIQNRDNHKLQEASNCSYLDSINHLNDLRKKLGR